MDMDTVETNLVEETVGKLVAGGWTDRREGDDRLWPERVGKTMAEIAEGLEGLTGTKLHLWTSKDSFHLTRVVGKAEAGVGLYPSGRMRLFHAASDVSLGNWLVTGADVDLATRFLTEMDFRAITAHPDFDHGRGGSFDTGLVEEE